MNIFPLTKSHIYKEMSIGPVALIYVDFISYLNHRFCLAVNRSRSHL